MHSSSLSKVIMENDDISCQEALLDNIINDIDMYEQNEKSKNEVP